MKIMSLFILFGIMLTSCSPMPVEVATLMPTTVSTTLSPAPEATHTTLPSSTSLPSSTPSPTPTISWPVFQKTIIPEIEYPIIATNNLENIINIAEYGAPSIRACEPILRGEYSVIIGASNGYWGINRYSDKAELLINQPAFSQWSGNYRINGNRGGLSYSSDGKVFLGTTEKNKFTIWDAAGKVLYEKETNPASSNTSASLSADGSIIAISTCDSYFEENNCNTELIDWKSDEVIKIIRGRYPVFSPDGQLLTVSFDKKIEFFSTLDWKMVRYLGQSYYGSEPVKFSPSGELFVYIIDSEVEIYRTQDGRLIRSITAADYLDNTVKILFTADESKVMLIGYEKQFLFDLSTGELLSTTENGLSSCYWLGESDEINQFGFNYFDWDINSEWFIKFAHLFDLHNIGPIQYFLQDNQKQFELRETTEPFRFEFYNNGKFLTFINGLKGNGIAAANEDYALISSQSGGPGPSRSQLVDLHTGDILGRWDSYANDVQFGSRYLIFTIVPLSGRTYKSDYSLIIFDLAEKRSILEKKGISGPLIVLENKKLVAFFDNEGCLSFENFGEELTPEKLCFLPTQYPNHFEHIRVAAISPDGKLIAVGTNLGNAYLIDFETHTLVKVIRIISDEIGNLQFSNDGTMLMGSPQYFDGNIEIWAIIER